MKVFFLSLAVFSSLTAFANENFQFSPKVETYFPVFAGGGVQLRAYDSFEWGLSYGVTPKAYYKVIANAAAHFGDNGSYKEVVEAAFQDNSLWRMNLQYNFSGKTGWNMGVAGSMLNSNGEAGIDTVLGASTGRNYTTLKNLLIALGRNPNVSMESDLTLAELYAGYTWDLGKSFLGSLTLGVTKVMSADVKVKTGLPNFEASAAGSSLLRSSETDLENIIEENGYSPEIGVKISYDF